MDLLGAKSNPWELWCLWECVVLVRPLPPSCVSEPLLPSPEAAGIPCVPLNPPSLHSSKGFTKIFVKSKNRRSGVWFNPPFAVSCRARVDIKCVLVNILTVAVAKANPELLTLHKAWNH